MVGVCFYFQVHQPERIRNYSVFEVGSNHDYWFHKKNRDILDRVAKKCYLPTNSIMLDQLKRHDDFKISYSVSGIALDQFERYNPSVISSFQKLVDTGKVEMIDETFYHSLAFLYSKREFREQVKMHRKKVYDLFGVKPTTFRNTELIYNNELAKEVENMGYTAVLAEGADRVLGWRSSNYVYKPTNANIKLLLKNYRLSDDIAFRFSNQDWKEWPLSTDKFAQWVNQVNGNGDVINLFMDYETFGEHQWASTGIFNFLRSLPGKILEHPDNTFVTPYEVATKYPVRDALDIPDLVSWADLERDVSAWLGNSMQTSSIKKLYELEGAIKELNDPTLLDAWRKLTTSDHFYYMCTKWFSDGDVHKYFNPYDSPYDAFITFMNIVRDIKQKMPHVVAEVT